MRREFLVCFFALIWIIGFGSVALAELPTLELPLPTQKDLTVETVIFSGDGSKMAVYCQEKTTQHLKDQVIFLYDFQSKKWMRGIEQADSFPWGLEPLALDQTGNLLAYRDGEDLVVLNLSTYQQIQFVDGVGSMSQAAFSRSGKTLVYLKMAEWEIPTSVYLLDLKSGISEEVVAYTQETKATGPIFWRSDEEIYYVEEFTWGTINAMGILKSYHQHKNEVNKVYEAKWKSSRVSSYWLSPSGQYLALVIRDLDDTLEQSKYALLIQKDGKFVYGAQLPGWRDRIESYVSKDLSWAGWVGEELFYWMNRSEQGYNLFIYDLEKKEQTQYQYSQPVLVTPTGYIIKLGR